MCAEPLAEFPNFSEVYFVATSKTVILGSLFSEKEILHAFISISVLNLSTTFMMENMLGNLQCKIMIFINWNDVSSNRFLWLPRYLMRQYFLLGSCSLKVKKYGAVLILLPMLAFMLVQYTASCASILVFSMPISLMCSCFNAPSCSNVGIIIFLPLLATPFRIAISSLHEFFLGITQI